MSIEASTAESLADWIETSVLVSAARRFGLDRLFDLASAEVSASESAVSSALRVMHKRAAVLGEVYPFKVDDLAVRATESPFLWDYATLLLLTPKSPARQTVRALETSEMAEILEELTARALANFWGTGGRAIRFGHPSRVGRPKEFDQAILWLARQIGVDAGRGYRPPRRKDGGVDVVAWHHFLDKRAGFPVVLAQCTIQGETFTKTVDIDLRLWASWLAMDVEPLSVLAIPGTIRRQGPEWSQLSSVVLVTERLRLIDLLSRGPVPGDEPSVWTKDTIASLKHIMLAAEY